MNRRKFLKGIAVSGALLAVSPKFMPNGNAEAAGKPKPIPFEEAVKKTLGVDVSKLEESTDIKLIAPSIAENGAVVPVKVQVNLPVEEVKSIHIFAKKNLNPHTMSMHLSPANGKAYLGTRIRLAKTMPVVAVAVLNNGKVIKAEKPIKVTIGGCG
ncbi:MAG: thiosulfate oxidation carrier protein SoxY [Aquificota bacterium]|nr:MAG: thiosulfate oxidation carrier protein SoxY [Aquificota bacterium]